MSLYEISTVYRQFMDLVELEEIPEEAIADTLEGIQGDFNDKADNIACVIKNLNAEAEAIKTEMSILDSRMKAKRNRANNLKQYLAAAMQKIGANKLETARNCLSFRKSTQLVIEDEINFMQKHADLCKSEIKITIPKADITKLLKSGQVITGARLVEKQNLQVK